MGDVTFRGLDLQAAGIWLDVASGLAEPAAVRGEDVTIPGKDGRTWMPKVKDHRTIELIGHVHGMGATLAARQAAWREATDALMAVMAFDEAPGALVVSGPYLGIPEGTEWTIDAVAVNVVGGPVQSTMTYQAWSFQLEALGDPPEWTVES